MNASKTDKEIVIVAMVEPQAVGTRFSMWPLHITIMPWFSAPDLVAVEEMCREAIQGLVPFTINVGERGFFGQRKLPVKLIMHSPELNRIHTLLLHKIEQYGWELQGRYVGAHFRPHITQKRGKDAKGAVRVDALYIVERLGQGYNQIHSKVELTHG